MIPTAEEFFREKVRELHPHQHIITLASILITAEQGMRWAQEYSILKAKFYVESALKAAAEYDLNCTCDSWESCRNKVDKDSIKNAYPLTNIK